jgi:hypothetical protein
LGTLKISQFGGTSAFATPNSRAVTLYDLYREIRRDAALNSFETQRTISQIEGVTRGATPDTQLTTLMAGGLGGTIGFLISKYFDMSPVSKVVSTAAGFGLGKVVHDQFNKPPPTDPPGWRIL